ncbi:threonylcarbamoyl-AMP synthase [Bacteroidetes/Chlorobi group bacterium Naka2016]|jgi:L-threonylcarbamoyladenylate synthase|nr:MAG: threonylcarbamoyl-AMP synthase [Bacteroidetes/Chlorobi group bacterium Naka2016]
MELNYVVDILLQGGIVGFPTETVYGIGCDIFNLSAVEKIFDLKKRDKTKPLAAHVGSFEQIEMVANTNVKFFETLYKKFLPGPLAIILPKKPIVDSVVTCGLETISIRFPDCKEAVELALGLGRPIAATSANLSGQPSAVHHEDVLKYFPDCLDFVVQSGFTKYRKESTIINLTVSPPKILRQGAIPIEEIEKVLQVKL